LIGIAGIDMKDKTESHEGVFGISLAKDYRGEGIGKILMRLVLEEAESNLPPLRIITLGVFSNNSLAMEMYKKFGFKEYGRLPKGVLHRGEYVDHVYMYKSIR
jgi:RimJ/RimL family protein N-acetyltransferase